jgi:hypothetical protein
MIAALRFFLADDEFIHYSNGYGEQKGTIKPNIIELGIKNGR